MSAVRLLHGDCREVMASMPAASVHSILTDPPYELGFMGKGWDSTGIAYDPVVWAEALRVLKPGGHLLAFGGTRTYHRMVCAIEDAGFEIRDQIGWVYGSGFPKSLDVSKAIDKARDDRADILRVTTFLADAADRACVTRADVDAAMGTSDMAGWWLSRLLHRCQCPKWEQWMQLKVLLALSNEMDAEVWRLNGRKGTPGNERADREVSRPGANEVLQPTQRVINPGTPVLDAARQWAGWGTALKPAWEPIVVARKPLVGTVAENVLAHGTGAMNIDGCRVPGEKPDTTRGASSKASSMGPLGAQGRILDDGKGRWPANIIHDGSDEVLAVFPQTGPSPKSYIRGEASGNVNTYGSGIGDAKDALSVNYGDTGSAARFFYSAKASSSERTEGLHSVTSKGRNHHPTVKPTDLMRYLCRLVTPPGGTVLDPFMGSGSTLKAAELEGFDAVGIELDEAYVAIARRRIASDVPLFAEVTG